MRPSSLVLISLLAAGSVSLLADPIPYPHVDSSVTSVGGTIDTRFISYNTADTDVFQRNDLTTNKVYAPSSNNIGVAQGASHSVGTFKSGDQLTSEIVTMSVNPQPTYTSDASSGTDGSKLDFVFTHYSVNPAVLEQISFLMLGTALFAAAGAFRYKFAR